MRASCRMSGSPAVAQKGRRAKMGLFTWPEARCGHDTVHVERDWGAGLTIERDWSSIERDCSGVLTGVVAILALTRAICPSALDFAGMVAEWPLRRIAGRHAQLKRRESLTRRKLLD